VQRGVEGATSWAEATGGGKHVHDSFACVHAGEVWHRQARALRQEQEKTVSAAIKGILEAEISQILDARKPTEGWKGATP
jgi:hypothetical protein